MSTVPALHGGPGDAPSRRRVLKHLIATTAGLTGLVAGLAAVPWGPAQAALRLPARRELAFRSLHTGEVLRATYLRNGALDPAAIADIDWVLRDWRTGQAIRMDRKLLDLLVALRGTLRSDAPFEVISAYRSPATNARLAAKSGGVAKRSLHMRGMAIDISLPGRSLKALYGAALDLKAGGVGLYSKSGFVHVDTGRVRRWGS